MSPTQSRQTDMSQGNKFKDAARQIEADEEEAHWEARLKAIARQQPKDAPVKPE